MASEYDVVGAFQDIEMELIKSMRRNMKRHIGEEFQEDINWTQWQAEMLNGFAKYKEENASMLKGYFSTINQDIEEAILEAYATGESELEVEILEAIRDGYKADKSSAMQGAFFKVNEDKLNALIKATTEDMQKAESAVLRMTNDVYRQTIFNAQMYYSTGAGSLWKAVDMATNDFLSRGINCVEYKNGARVNIASYSEMALRTANKRANLMGCAGKRMEYGIHTVKISAHNSACPLCIQWQGKVYYDDVYGSITPAEKNGKYPLLSEAVKGGMFHPNCKNGLSTYYEGINQLPKEPTKEEKEEMVRRYNLQQEQRACERNIRKYKRLEAGSLDADNVGHYSKKKQEWIGAYKKLIAENPDVLRAEPARLKLYGISAKDLKPATSKYFKASNNNSVASLTKPIRPKKTDFDDFDKYEKAREKYRSEREKYDEQFNKVLQKALEEPPVFKTKEQVIEWTKKNNITIDDEVLEVIDLRSFNEVKSTLEEMFEKYPHIKSYDIEYDGGKFKTTFNIGLDDDGLLSANRGFNFNRKLFQNYEYGLSEGLELMTTDFNVRGDGTFSTLVRHEFGHNVQNYIEFGISNKYHHGADDWRKYYKTFDDWKESDKAYWAEYHSYEKELISLAQLKGVSEYAQTNKLELFAEGFAEYTSGGNTEFGKAFGKFLERWYK